MSSKRCVFPAQVGWLLVLLAVVPFAAVGDEGDPDTPQVDLPRVGLRRAPGDGEVPPVVLHLLASGDVVLGDTKWSLATGRPEEQVKALRALRDELQKRTAMPELREPDRSSKVSVVIYGDRNARWQYVQWIMQICAEPTVLIYKIRFVVHPAGGEDVEEIEAQLPKDRGIGAEPGVVDEVPIITVKLFRRGTEDEDPLNDFTRIRVGHEYTFELPKGTWTGEAEKDEARLKAYEQTLKGVTAAIREYWTRMGERPEVKGEIKTPRPLGLKVPYGDVIRVLDGFLEVGIADVRFEGAPAPMPVRSGR